MSWIPRAATHANPYRPPTRVAPALVLLFPALHLTTTATAIVIAIENATASRLRVEDRMMHTPLICFLSPLRLLRQSIPTPLSPPMIRELEMLCLPMPAQPLPLLHTSTTSHLPMIMIERELTPPVQGPTLVMSRERVVLTHLLFLPLPIRPLVAKDRAVWILLIRTPIVPEGFRVSTIMPATVLARVRIPLKNDTTTTSHPGGPQRVLTQAHRLVLGAAALLSVNGSIRILIISEAPSRLLQLE